MSYDLIFLGEALEPGETGKSWKHLLMLGGGGGLKTEIFSVLTLFLNVGYML